MNDSPSSPASTSARGIPAAEFAAVVFLDATGRVTTASTAARTLWQAGQTELIGTPFPALFTFDVTSNDPDWVAAQWDVLLAATLNRAADLETRPLDGAPRPVLVRLEPLPGAGYLATVQPQPAPAAAPDGPANGGFQLLADAGIAGFFDLDLKTGRVAFSPAWKRILGYSGSELSDTLEAWRQLIHPDDSAASPDRLAKKSATGTRPFNVEYRMRHRLGHWVWVQCLGLQVVDAEGVLERIVGVHIDITDRKELEEASLANDERLELLANVGPIGAFDLDFTNQVFWFSSGWKKILGYRDDELPAKLSTFAAALPPEDNANGVDTWLLLRAPSQSVFIETESFVTKSGNRISVLFGAHRTLTRKRDLARVTGFICAAPRTAEGEGPGAIPSALVRDTLATLAEGVLVTDAEGKVLHLNPTASRLLSRQADSVIGESVNDVLRLVHRETGHPGDDPCERALLADHPLPMITDHALAGPLPDQKPRPIVWTARASFDSSGQARGVVIVFRDPAEMNLTPDELVRANRFESLGLLAGGIAHDFNNLLTTVLGGISLARENRDGSALGDAEQACITAKALTRQLLAFAKGSSGNQSIVSAQEIFDDAVKIAASGSATDVSIEIAENLPPMRVDRAQILQVFQNLIVNALQAMPPPPHRPRIQLSAGPITIGEGELRPLPAGDYLELEVRDNASGIDPENLQRIFDPFFTTKKHGTGLGLSTVLTIVRKHGGQIGVDSAKGIGTAFTVYLPVADAPVEVQARRAASLRFGTGRVLLMDDDPNVSAITATMLEGLEYKYDIAKNGDEAIQYYQRYLNIGRPYDVVILDITVVGGMGGEECFKALRDLDPDVRAIVSSGYDSDEIARRFLDMGFCGYLTKPYRVGDLGKVIKAVVG